jgi:hypothetical protein
LFSCGGVCCSGDEGDDGDDGDDGDCIHVLVHGFRQEDLTQRAQRSQLLQQHLGLLCAPDFHIIKTWLLITVN